jgi:hypothetical protein
MIAVGGLINERSEDLEKKVPFLGDIPYLGFFFSDIEKVRRRTEMVILIRPYVMNNGYDSVDANKTWLEQNSVHPSADKLHSLGIYKNTEHLDNGFEVQENYKLYKGQDSFDDYHEKGKGAKAELIPKNERQTIYMSLTQYATQAVKLPKHMRPLETGIIDIPLRQANLGAPFLLHETLGCPIANLHSARSDLWEPQFVLRPTQLRRQGNSPIRSELVSSLGRQVVIPTAVKSFEVDLTKQCFLRS